MSYYRIMSTTLTWDKGSDTLPGLGHTYMHCWLDGAPSWAFLGGPLSFYFTELGWAEYQETLALAVRQYKNGDVAYDLSYDVVTVTGLRRIIWEDDFQVAVQM